MDKSKLMFWITVLILTLSGYVFSQLIAFLFGTGYLIAVVFVWVFICLYILYLFTQKFSKACLYFILIALMNQVMYLQCSNLASTYIDYRQKNYYETQYGATVTKRGGAGWRGTAHLVYYLSDEPEYPFRAYAKLSDTNFDYEYHHATTAILLDNFLEDKFDEIIEGDFKFSTDSLSMKIHENPENMDVHQRIENISYIQMYCFLEESLKTDKELVMRICDELEQHFKNTKSSIYFAFVEDPLHCQKFSKEFYAAEDAYIRLNDGYKEGTIFESDQSDSNIEKEPFKSDDQWVQMIVDSGVFSEYCSNPSVITLDEWDGHISIKAQPKDVPTISVIQNPDGTFSSECIYIIEKDLPYYPKAGELAFRIFLNNREYEEISCSLYYAQKTYPFNYSVEDKEIYSHTELNFDIELLKEILYLCEETIKEINELDNEAHKLMETILKAKGYKNITWK